jgi:oligopeptidase B
LARGFRDPSVLDPNIRKHLEAENAYQRALMADTETFRKTLFAEMKGRIKEDDSSVPMADGPFAYGTSYKTGGEQPRYFRIPATAALSRCFWTETSKLKERPISA